jgi:predicted acylesterase/phospholipase RssA
MRLLFSTWPAVPLMVVLVLVLALGGCAHQTPRFDPQARPTCLVLSAGGTRGVVHLGALAAVREAGIPVRCVVGTSVGALVGSLYASAPAEDTTMRFRRLVDAYLAETERDAHVRGLAAGLALAAVAAVLTDGWKGPAAAALGGYALGAGTVTRADLARLTRVLGAQVGGARIEALPVPFATFHHERAGDGLKLVVDRTGDLASAVGASIANPFVFDDVQVTQAPALDPGADRIVAVPVEDACRLFPGSNLLVVNLSGAPAVRPRDLTCPVREVLVDHSPLPAEAAFKSGPEFDAAFDKGKAAVRAALGAAG